MKYIWVNPVVIEMYKRKEINLEAHLIAQDFQVVEGDLQVLDEVRNQFIDAVEENKGIVLDTRCPLAIEKLTERYDVVHFYIPAIYPILIRTAFYLYEKYIQDSMEDELYIMCPCKALSDLGNTLSQEQRKKGINFYPWNEWVKAYPIPQAEKIGFTPIPLGFFKESDIKVKGLTGKEDILSEVPRYKELKENNIQLIEMLYCKGGCHNGDGV